MSADLNKKYYRVFFTLALCALIVPLWIVEVPPLVDLPNHLARVFVLAHYDETAFFQQNFQVNYEPVPNLAIDLIVAPLMTVFDIWTANRLFLTLIVILFAAGCHLISARTGESRSFSVIPAMFLIYGGTFFYGYVNYVFGIALFLVTFGLWLRWREKPSFGRFAVIVALTFAVYLSHLSAIAFFGIAVFFVDAYDFFTRAETERKWKSVAANCALFILPAMAFLTFMSGTGNVGALKWNTFTGKAVALFGPFRSYDLWLDLICVALLASFCFWMKQRGLIIFDWRILSVSLLFLLIFLLSPHFFFTDDADVRIVLPGFVLLILSCRVNVSKRETLALFSVLLCFLALRQTVISYRWIQISEKMTAEKKLLDAIAPQSKVYPIFVKDSDDPEEKLERPLINAVHFVTMKNYSFAPSLFAFRGQQPLVFRDGVKYATLEGEDKTKWLQYLNDNDYVWVYGAPQTVSDELEKRAFVIAESGKTRIWKLNK